MKQIIGLSVSAAALLGCAAFNSDAPVASQEGAARSISHSIALKDRGAIPYVATFQSNQGGLEICGVRSVQGDPNPGFVDAVLRDLTVRVDGTAVLSDMRFFTEAPSPEALGSVVPTCRATPLPFAMFEAAEEIGIAVHGSEHLTVDES